jgi:chromosome segregation ATPase
MLFCSLTLLKAQDEQPTFDMDTAVQEDADYAQQEENPVEQQAASDEEAKPVVVTDTLLPVRKSFIRRANIIFKDRDRLRAEAMRLRAEIADLNKDMEKKDKQVKEVTNYINNQTFALNDAKKNLTQCTEERDGLQDTLEQMNEELRQARRGKIIWTIGGVVVGIGIGIAIGMIVSGG